MLSEVSRETSNVPGGAVLTLEDHGRDVGVSDWHTLYTRSRHEKKVERQLHRLGAESYLPLIERPSRRVDRRKTIEEPLFPGYLFFRSEKSMLFDIAQSYGVVRILGVSYSEPAIVDDEIIHFLRQLVAAGPKVERCPKLKEGDAVRVVHGPLSGLEGTLVRDPRGARVVIWVRAIASGASVEVSLDDVELLNEAKDL